MNGHALKQHLVRHVLTRVQQPAQYLGSELNIVRKDHGTVRGKLCLAFPDTYTIGMSHHGMQVLYTLMNRRDDWVCERVFAPWTDMEEELRRGDRRMARAIELAWQNGSRMDSWTERFDGRRWWAAMEEAGIDFEQAIHEPYDLSDRLPWDHVNVKYGRTFLEKEQNRSVVQLASMAGAE